MPIEFRCPSCDRILRTPDESAGKKARCPQCAAIVDIPLTSTLSGETERVEGERGGDFGGAAPAGGVFGAGGTFGAGDVPSGATSGSPETAANPFTEQATSYATPESTRRAGGEANPYAAPTLDSFSSASSSGDESPRALVPSKVDLGEVLQSSLEICADQITGIIVTCLVYAGLYVAVRVAERVLPQAALMTRENIIVGCAVGLSVLFSILANTWLQFGLSLFSLRFARSGRTQTSDLFAVGPYFLRACGLTLVLALLFGAVIAVLVVVPVAAVVAMKIQPEFAFIAGGAGLLIALPILLYLGVEWYMAPYFVLDGRTGVFQALSESKRFADGNRVAILLLIMLLGMAKYVIMIGTCCIGLLVYVPFASVVASILYLRATGQSVYQVPKTMPTLPTGLPPQKPFTTP